MKTELIIDSDSVWFTFNATSNRNDRWGYKATIEVLEWNDAHFVANRSANPLALLQDDSDGTVSPVDHDAASPLARIAYTVLHRPEEWPMRLQEDIYACILRRLKELSRALEDENENEVSQSVSQSVSQLFHLFFFTHFLIVLLFIPVLKNKKRH